MQCTAILLAGSRPGRDPLAARFGGDLKALVPVAGEPMVVRPARALLGSAAVDRLIVVAQQPERIGEVLPADERLTVRKSEASIAQTILDLCNDPGTEWPLLVTTADHALLDGAMIAEFLDRAAGADLAIAVVEQRNLLSRFPDAKRTWLKFRRGAYSGANLFFLGSPDVRSAIALWRGAEQGRKKGWRLLVALGPATLIGAALRLLTIDQVAQRLGRKLRLAVRIVRMSNPLAAVDVDKPEDHALVEAILAGER